MAVPQNQQQAATALVEEKFFNISLGQNGSLIKQALEEASGMELEELAPGMWTGSREVGWGSSLEITARAQAVEDGTSVEVRVEHRSSPGAVAAWIFLIIAAAVILLPLIPIIMWGTKLQKQHQRERLVLMHKLWGELAAVVGAPRRASYRESPQRSYAPGGRIETAPEGRPRIAETAPTDSPAADEQAALEEAAAAEEAEATRQTRS
ncbi:MAG: hypothetical protein JRI23_17515 [Deltaproteobacteria bacterium]|jgi:hypothetical protein|nr:hypothetical protein [Deltaproteobacteria bacterium]MBW2533620.1 hypothetical protein [Deltaproteobacteria bacterium]